MVAAPGFNDPSTPRAYVTIKASMEIDCRSLSIRESDDDPSRKRYRPYLLEKEGNTADWFDDLELGTVTTMAAEYLQRTRERMKVLVLFGSLRQNVRPTQGRTLAIAQVSGGSQSFNTVISLDILGRWMRMFTIPNQSSIPKAYTQYMSEGGDDDGRLRSRGNRDRLVDCMEEFIKYTIVMKPHFALFGDRFSERQEKRQKDLEAKESQLVVDGKQASSEGLEGKDKINGHVQKS
ncbi:MAG: hypothetical protein Q9171_001080 [Xanthocarpia ochracea]